MAVINKITLTFSEISNIEINEFLRIGMSNGSKIFNLTETFRPIRTSFGLVGISADSNDYIENTLNFGTAVNLDGTLYGLNAVVYLNTIELTLDNDIYYFTGVSGTLVDNGRVTYTTETREPITSKSVLIDSYTAKSPFCTDINAILNVTGGSELYDVYVDNVLILEDETTPITVALKRGSVSQIRVIDSLSETIGVVTASSPRKVISSDITTSVLNLNTGANLSIFVKYISPYVSPYEYSLDGVTYQESNLYTGLAADEYTIYVKDALGCVNTKTININGETELTETVFSISNINSFSFSKIESGKKNYLNTISVNSLTKLAFPYYQEYLDSDIITTQFKTNAAYINVFTIDCDLNTNTLTAVKRTTNTGLVAKSTSTYFSLGEGRSAIYFGAVDLLDPITDTVIGDADFGFTLPEWANKVGNYVTIEGIGQVPIDSIGYSETYQSFVIEFNIEYTGSAVEKKIAANYNLQPYEIYEFMTTMNSEATNFNVVIEVGTSSENIEYSYVSENIRKVEDSEFLFDIDYYMDDDRNLGGMVYQTGIKNKLRLKGQVDYVGEQETQGYDGDTQYYVTDNTVYDMEKFSFFRLSTNMLRKLRQVVTHSFLMINGIRYYLAETPEIPQNEGNSNIKNFFVTLKSGGNQILEDSQEQINDTSVDLEIASLIEAGEGKGGLLWTKTNG